MTRKREDRTAAVEHSALSRSWAYELHRLGRSALPAALGQQDSNNYDNGMSDTNVGWFEEFNAPEWYLNSLALFERHLDYGEALDKCARDLGMTMQNTQAIVQQLEVVNETRIALRFKLPQHSNLRYPRKPRNEDFARHISVAVDAVTRKSPRMAETAITFYAKFVQKDNRLVLTDERWAPEFRHWMLFLRQVNRAMERELGADSDVLHLKLLGFRVNGVEPDLKHKLSLLGLKASDSSIHFVNAHNQNSPASLEHIGMTVESDSARDGGIVVRRSCEAFRYVMALAAISRIWTLYANKQASAGRPVQSPQPLAQAMLFSEPENA